MHTKDSNSSYGILCYFRKFGVHRSKKNYLHMLRTLRCDSNKVYAIYIPCSWRASAVALVGTSGLQWDFRKEPWQLKFKRNNSANTIFIDLTSNWIWRHVWNFGVNFFAVSDFVDKIYQPLSVPCVPPSILQKRFIGAHKYEEKVVLMACTQWICIY